MHLNHWWLKRCHSPQQHRIYYHQNLRQLLYCFSKKTAAWFPLIMGDPLRAKVPGKRTQDPRTARPHQLLLLPEHNTCTTAWPPAAHPAESPPPQLYHSGPRTPSQGPHKFSTPHQTPQPAPPQCPMAPLPRLGCLTSLPPSLSPAQGSPSAVTPPPPADETLLPSGPRAPTPAPGGLSAGPPPNPTSAQHYSRRPPPALPPRRPARTPPA